MYPAFASLPSPIEKRHDSHSHYTHQRSNPSRGPVAIMAFFLMGIYTELGFPDFTIIDVSLIFVGVQLGFSSIVPLFLIGAILAGRLVGSFAILIICRMCGNAFSSWLCRHSPKMANKLISLEGKMDRHTISALLFTRLGPHFVTAASIASGLSNVKYSQFAIGVAVSGLIADGSRFLAGYMASRGASLLGMKFQTWQLVVGVVVLITLFWWLMFRLQQWREKRWPNTRKMPTKYPVRTCPMPVKSAKID